MARKASDFVNLPVIHLVSGQQLNIIKDIVLNADNDKLYGFICEDYKLLPVEAIKTIGKDAIIIEAENIEDVLIDIELPVSAPLFVPEHVIGTPIITDTGKNIGTIGDIYLSDTTGKIESYEVSDGLLKDLVSGRSNIPILQVVTYGEDAVVINEK